MKPPVLIIIGMIGWMIGVTTGAGAYEARVTQIVHKNQFPKVTVYLSVLDPNGQPVTGLAASNFKLTENDREVTDLRPGNLKSEPVSAMLVMDRSGSMDTANKMQGAKEAASKFIQLMNPQDRCGIITFDDNIETLQSLTSDQQALLKKVKAIEPGAQTAFYDAVYEAINQHKEIPGRKLIIALTDGLDNSSRRQRQEIVNYAQQEGIPVDTIGLGQKSRRLQTKGMTNADSRTWPNKPVAVSLFVRRLNN